MVTPRLALCIVLVLALLTPGASQSLAQPATSPTAPASSAAPGSMLLVENAGQWPTAARFQVWNSPLGAGMTWLAEDGIWLVVASGKLQVAGSEGFAGSRADLPPANLQPATFHALKLTFPGSNPDVRIEPFDALTTTVSYFIGNDPDQWRLAVPVWGRVRYVDLYPGVDLVLGGRDNAWQLEAARGAAVERVRVQVEGAAIVALDGLKLQLDVDGEPLSVTLPPAPLAYRASGVSRQGEPLTLTVDPGPRASQPASPVDDPADLLYGTFLGGSYSETGYSIAIDGAGSVYVTGNTWSSDFPTTSGAFDPSYNGNNSNTFVAKLNPAGSELAYATFLGGSALDYGHGIVVDATGSAYLTGGTRSNDFPTTPGSFDRTHNGQYDAFVAKLNPVGSELVCATFLGGNFSDDGYGIDVDGAGRTYVTGYTGSSDFPTTPGAFDTSYNGGGDAFVFQLNPACSELPYSTFMGGSGTDGGDAIAVDGVNNVYGAGRTRSIDFPTTSSAFDMSFNGNIDAFVVILNPAVSALAYGTFLGGNGGDYGYGIAVDLVGSAYVTGWTGSDDFPTTPDAFDPSLNSWQDAFFVKLNPTGSELVYGTFLGGSSSDFGYGVAVDGAGSAYVTGFTRSSNFPTTSGAFDRSYNGSDDAFVVKLNPDHSELAYASFLGGNAADRGLAITVDEAGITCFTGLTSSSDFPTTPDAFDPTFNGGEMDVFVTKLDVFGPPSAVALASLQAGHGSNGRFARLVAAVLGLMVMVSIRMLRQEKPSNR